MAVLGAALLVAACASSNDSPVSPEPVVPAEVIVPSVKCATELGTFGGLQWQARTAALAGPGPNAWNACQAWLDSDGMHLRLDRVNGVWTSAEVFTTTPLGYGRLEFELATPVHALDPNVVLGFFTYPGGTLDGLHEIDIEFSRFGSTTAPNLNYVVYPTSASKAKGQCSGAWNVAQASTVHRFIWSATYVEFQSFATPTIGATTVPTRAWRFAPTDLARISSGAWPLHINLWSYLGRPPSDGAPVEVVIKRVTYSAIVPTTPQPSTVCP